LRVDSPTVSCTLVIDPGHAHQRTSGHIGTELFGGHPLGPTALPFRAQRRVIGRSAARIGRDGALLRAIFPRDMSDMPKKRGDRAQKTAEKRARREQRQLAREEKVREEHARLVLERSHDPRFTQRIHRNDGTSVYQWPAGFQKSACAADLGDWPGPGHRHDLAAVPAHQASTMLACDFFHVE
jgi:hypothetical protein